MVRSCRGLVKMSTEVPFFHDLAHVEQEDAGVHGQGPRGRHALLLTAGELCRVGRTTATANPSTVAMRKPSTGASSDHRKCPLQEDIVSNAEGVRDISADSRTRSLHSP